MSAGTAAGSTARATPAAVPAAAAAAAAAGVSSMLRSMSPAHRPDDVTGWQNFWGALLLYFIGLPVLLPLGIISLLGKGMRWLNSYFGKAVGARLVPVKGKYTFSLPLGGPLACFKLSEVRMASMRALHKEAVHKRWFDTLTTIIIVSGLLTTSSYQAVYSSYALYPKTPGVCPDATVCPAPGTAEVAFRAANAISFLTSITTIISSTMVIFAINEFVLDESSKEETELADWACVLIAMGYKLTTTSFFVSLAAAIAAMAFGSPAFFSRHVVGWVIWGIIIATVVCILTGMMVSGVEPDSQTNSPGAAAAPNKQSTHPPEAEKSNQGTAALQGAKAAEARCTEAVALTDSAEIEVEDHSPSQQREQPVTSKPSSPGSALPASLAVLPDLLLLQKFVLRFNELGARMGISELIPCLACMTSAVVVGFSIAMLVSHGPSALYLTIITGVITTYLPSLELVAKLNSSIAIITTASQLARFHDKFERQQGDVEQQQPPRLATAAAAAAREQQRPPRLAIGDSSSSSQLPQEHYNLLTKHLELQRQQWQQRQLLQQVLQQPQQHAAAPDEPGTANTTKLIANYVMLLLLIVIAYAIFPGVILSFIAVSQRRAASESSGAGRLAVVPAENIYLPVIMAMHGLFLPSPLLQIVQRQRHRRLLLRVMHQLQT